jgi:hypothetical protein
MQVRSPSEAGLREEAVSTVSTPTRHPRRFRVSCFGATVAWHCTSRTHMAWPMQLLCNSANVMQLPCNTHTSIFLWWILCAVTSCYAPPVLHVHVMQHVLSKIFMPYMHFMPYVCAMTKSCLCSIRTVLKCSHGAACTLYIRAMQHLLNILLLFFASV